MLLFIVGLVGFFSLMAGSLFVATSDLGEAADGFFQSVAHEDFTVARDFLAVDYSNSMTDEEFEKFIRDYRLNEYTSSFWNNRTINNDNGQLSGTITTSSGENIPVQMNLVFELEQWKIRLMDPQNNPTPPKTAATHVQNENLTSENSTFGDQSLASDELLVSDELQPSNEHQESDIPLLDADFAFDTTEETIPPAPVQDIAPVTQPASNGVTALKVSSPDIESGPESALPAVLTINDIPTFEVANAMTKLWTTQFCKGVGQKDFSSFHQQLAPQMQEKFPLQKFTKVFQQFIDRKIDLRWAKNVNPIFDQNPSLDANGILVLIGHFPANPRVDFNYAFKRIDNSWKPVRVNLVVPPAEKANSVSGLPDVDKLKQVVIATTKSFGKSVSKKDFTSFHRSTYSKFQEKFSVQQFASYFESFVKQNANLNWIDGIQPVFDVTPSINLNGFLSMEGHFPSEPKVLFRYAFVNEDGKWKVSTINLSIETENQVKTKVQQNIN